MKTHRRVLSAARRIWPSLALAMAILPVGLSAFAANAEATPEQNIYKLGPITAKALEQWKTLPGTRLRFSWRGKTDPYCTLQEDYDISRAEDTVHGMYREGLNLPLPEELRFWTWGDEPYMWVSLADKKGHTFMSRVPIEMKFGEWVQIRVPIKPVRGGNPVSLEDLDSIAILELDGAGENPFSETKMLRFGHFELLYPEGQGPKNVVYSKDDIESIVKPLDTSIPRIEGLMQQAKAAGAETRYFMTSLTVLKKYRIEVSSMIKEDDPSVAFDAAQFLLNCSDRLEGDLKAVIADPRKSIHVPNISLHNLRVHDGGIFSNDRPVYLLGVDGWFDESRFDTLSGLGYTLISGEIGPSSTLPESGKTDTTGVDNLTRIMNLAAKNNIAFDMLLSPHYMPDWAYKEWPDLDPENRRASNNFMPWDIRSPHLKEVIAKHLALTIPKVRENPSLLGYDLINEAWYRPLIGVSDRERAQFLRNHPGMSRWQAEESLTTEETTKFIRWYVDELQKHDNVHPAYVKVVGNDEVQGVSREALGKILTANGMDNFPTYPDLTGELAADLASMLLRIDFHRSLTPKKAIMDGEYHICPGGYDTPTLYMRTALWAPVLHGKDSSALWGQDRVDLGSVDWHPNCVEELGHSALDFLRLGSEIRAFEMQKPSTAVMYGGTGIRETYQAALFLDRDLGIVTNDSAAGGALSKYKAVIVPFGFRPTPTAAKKIADFAKNGGKVVRCGRDLATDLWPTLHTALAGIPSGEYVKTDRWGVECRSTLLGGRKLFYVINYTRTPVTLKPRSNWDISKVKELRTQVAGTAKQIHLEPLEMKIFEVAAK